MNGLFLVFVLSLCIQAKFIVAEEPFHCVRCENCEHSNYIPEPCPASARGCITVRMTRNGIIMDCLTDKMIQWYCDHERLANGTCEFCNDHWGCNQFPQDALVCRSCDWTTTGECEVQKVCRAPFRTLSPLCYILYRYPFGFHFGCLDDMSPTIEFLMSQDRHRLTYNWCDSHDCNSHAKNFWPYWASLMDPIRICHVCFQGSEYCGPKVCPMESIYSRLCLKTFDGAMIKCMADVTNLFLSRFIETHSEYICGSDNCQKDDVKPLYECTAENQSIEKVYSIKDGCAMVICK